MSKRIGVDFHVADGIFQGSRTYLMEIFPRLITISPEFEFFLFLEDVEGLRQSSSVFSLPNVHLVNMPHANPIKRLCWQLPLMQKKFQLDLLHVQYVMPFPNNCPCMVSLHDVIFESYPQYFTPLFRLRSMVLIRLSALRAAHLFTISDFSKEEIHRHYNIDINKISLVHCAVDRNRFFPGLEGENYIKQRGLTTGGYILTVGRLEPRKNHVNLIKAYASSEVSQMPLVIVGQRHFDFDKIFNLVKELGLDERVIFIDDATDEELPALYRHAALFVYPTWAEGFGMPPLEAMASGVPVISSNTTSIPEVVGDAGVLLNPNDIDGIADAISKFINSKKRRTKASQQGLIQTERFDWAKSANKVKQAYINFFNAS